MGTVSQSTRCSECGEPLPEGLVGACTKCGETRKTHYVHIQETLQARASLGLQHIHEYYERHPVLLPVVLAITIGSPFLGLVLAGLAGVFVGLAIGVGMFFLGLRAVTKVRHIREWPPQ